MTQKYYLQSLDVRNVSLQDMDVTPSKSEELLGGLLVPNETKDRVVWRLAQLVDELQLRKKIGMRNEHFRKERLVLPRVREKHRL